jgi:hypothetical protein
MGRKCDGSNHYTCNTSVRIRGGAPTGAGHSVGVCPNCGREYYGFTPGTTITCDTIICGTCGKAYAPSTKSSRCDCEHV